MKLIIFQFIAKLLQEEKGNGNRTTVMGKMNEAPSEPGLGRQRCVAHGTQAGPSGACCVPHVGVPVSEPAPPAAPSAGGAAGAPRGEKASCRLRSGREAPREPAWPPAPIPRPPHGLGVAATL